METGAELSAVAAGCGVAPPGPTATFLASASRRRNAARRADFACRLGGFPRPKISLFRARGAARAVANGGMARAVLFIGAIRGTTTRTAALKSTRVGSNHQRALSQAAIARVPPLENAHSRAPPNKAGTDCVPLISPARAGKATIASNVIAVNTASTSATTTTDRARGAEHIFLHELERQGATFILPIITCFTSAFAAEYSKVED